MQTTVLATVLVAIVALAECGISRVSAPDMHVGEAGSPARVEEKFAVRFCYRQHTNQTDVSQCLLRNANLAADRSR